VELCLISVLRLGLAVSPVTELNATQYFGRWYQVYTDYANEKTFENNSFCSTADYAPNANGTISVNNRERYKSVSGPETGILGWATVPDSKKPGELLVHLQIAVPVPAPYWVYALGPVVDGLYDYSVVSDNLLFSLFVLTRNVTRFATDYDVSVQKFLAASGFTEFYNKPIPLVQAGCKYWN